jgi:hypothetical protein
MSRYELTRSALADIDELWTYIAEDNVEAADRVSTAILDACELLAEQPSIGHTRGDSDTEAGVVLVEWALLDCLPTGDEVAEDCRHLPWRQRRRLAPDGP